MDITHIKGQITVACTCGCGEVFEYDTDGIDMKADDAAVDAFKEAEENQGWNADGECPECVGESERCCCDVAKSFKEEEMVA